MISDAHYYTVESHTSDGQRHVISAELKKQTVVCPHCNSDQVVGFGRKKEQIADVPVRGVPVLITLNRRRYRCKQCGKTFMEPVPNKTSHRQMTDALLLYIMSQAKTSSLRSIASDVGVDEKTIRMIVRD